jgi:hypothetical protein
MQAIAQLKTTAIHEQEKIGDEAPVSVRRPSAVLLVPCL